MAGTYSYTELEANEIRLLELHHSPESPRLVRRIFAISRAEAPAYTAISYRWNTNVPYKTITCDAVCINQLDSDEMGRQVSMMRMTYNSAAMVHIWLGDEDGDTGRAFEIVDEFAGGQESSASSDEVPGDTALLGHRRMVSSSIMGYDHPPHDHTALLKLLSKPWFSRIWIVQEISSARRAEVYCGNFHVDWDRFAQGVLYGATSGCLNLELREVKQVLSLVKTREQYQHNVVNGSAQDDRLRLLRLLLRHHGFSSGDPLDMIYALKALAGMKTTYEEHQERWKYYMSPDFHLPSTIDFGEFTKDRAYEMGKEELYTTVAGEILATCKNLDVLVACSYPSQLEECPSWIPDWSTSGMDRVFSPEDEIFFHHSASGMSEWEHAFYDENGDVVNLYDMECAAYLAVSGMILDSIGLVASDISSKYPSETREGDRIGLFAGARCPFVLRKSEEELHVRNAEEHNVHMWKLVGACYIDAIMDGSAFDPAKCEPHWIA